MCTRIPSLPAFLHYQECVCYTDQALLVEALLVDRRFSTHQKTALTGLWFRTVGLRSEMHISYMVSESTLFTSPYYQIGLNLPD